MNSDENDPTDSVGESPLNVSSESSEYDHMKVFVRSLIKMLDSCEGALVSDDEVDNFVDN